MLSCVCISCITVYNVQTKKWEKKELVGGLLIELYSCTNRYSKIQELMGGLLYEHGLLWE